LRRRLAEEPMDFLVRQAPPLLWQARERLARFLGGDPRRLVFTANVTAPVNTVPAALRLAAPREIFLTHPRYGALHRCLERAAPLCPWRPAPGRPARPPPPRASPCPTAPACCSSATSCRRPGWCCRPGNCAPRPGGAASGP